MLLLWFDGDNVSFLLLDDDITDVVLTLGDVT